MEGTLHGSKDKKLVRIQCTYDNTWLPLCPPRSDLRAIMVEHTLSKSHMMASQNEKSANVPAITGVRGRPKKANGKDPKQQSLGRFLIPTPRNQNKKDAFSRGEDSKYCSTTSAFIVNPLNTLCWGLWHETINKGGREISIKPLLDDQKHGREWFSEPQTHTTIIYNMEEYVVNGYF